MRRFSLTFIASILFIASLIGERGSFSRETSLEAHRDMFHVEQGVTDDGTLAISMLSNDEDVEIVTPWIANHNRTLRTAFGAMKNDEDRIVIEDARLHRRYLVTGGFRVTREKVPAWVDGNHLVFEANGANNITSCYTLGVSSLAYRSESIPCNVPRSVDNEGGTPFD